MYLQHSRHHGGRVYSLNSEVLQSIDEGFTGRHLATGRNHKYVQGIMYKYSIHN